ncbi:MAG TPA: hypothetical protein P5217_03495 [Methanoregulaceae archaeon]|nr:hypothetical protein [Methanoregulaceae archaeon]HPD75780.1 hypothetical protein [Methanoregulaceae archaeon]HRY75325.1 hypothetical protein [Methanoregulaceae archaeon]
MKNQVLFAGILLLLIAILPAAASPVVGIHDDGICYVLDADEDLVPATCQTIAANPSGVAVLACEAKLTDGAAPADSVIIYDAVTGGSCSTALGLTTRWQEVITSDGIALLVCNNQYAEML